MAINDKDQQLIALLRNQARMPISEVARRLQVSRTAAQARLQRLERDGVIQGYSLRLSEDYVKDCIKAIVMIKSPAAKRESIETTLHDMPQLVNLYSISGAFDLSAVVMAPTVNELDKVIDAIGIIEGVEETQSSVILSTKL